MPTARRYDAPTTLASDKPDNPHKDEMSCLATTHAIYYDRIMDLISCVRQASLELCIVHPSTETACRYMELQSGCSMQLCSSTLQLLQSHDVLSAAHSDVYVPAKNPAAHDPHNLIIAMRQEDE